MFKHLTYHGIRLFKANYTEKYDDWLAAKGINNEAEAEDSNAPPWKDTKK